MCESELHSGHIQTGFQIVEDSCSLSVSEGCCLEYHEEWPSAETLKKRLQSRFVSIWDRIIKDWIQCTTLMYDLFIEQGTF